MQLESIDSSQFHIKVVVKSVNFITQVVIQIEQLPAELEKLPDLACYCMVGVTFTSGLNTYLRHHYLIVSNTYCTEEIIIPCKRFHFPLLGCGTESWQSFRISS